MEKEVKETKNGLEGIIPSQASNEQGIITALVERVRELEAENEKLRHSLIYNFLNQGEGKE